MVSLVVTVVGRDRPGLVKAISDVAVEHRANWAESRMAQLAGQFAGIVHLQVPAEQVDPLVVALQRLREIGLAVDLARGGPAPRPGRIALLELVGQDRPGIVREVARALAARGVSIEELDTRFESGSFTGEPLFRATARLHLDAEASADELRASLESLANDLMVDIALEAPEKD
ncbi:MAG TPA: ACT domain-containing protein [Burkholderiaceae bacterium]|nr:ACT domain-containing protein [Burkholderiaceae bacterium]